MTKYEADVIGGLNMTDQISNEAYTQIMSAAQDEDEVGEVLDKIRAEIEKDAFMDVNNSKFISINRVNQIINKYKNPRN